MVLTTVGRLGLAMVFVVAAISKLAGRPGVAEAAAGLGVAPRMAQPVARLLPVAELAVAGMLLWRPSVVVGAAAGLFLLALFTSLVVLNLRRGRRPSCRCFGQVGEAPIGARTVVRNVVLMGLALVVLVTA